MLPVLLIVVLPVPVCEIPVIVNAALFVSDNAPPPVLVALKLEITFVPAPLNVSPPTEFKVRSPVVLINPETVLSEIVPPEVNVILLAPEATEPVMTILPAALELVTETAPVPVCDMPVIVKGDAVTLLSEIIPTPLFVALKLVTVLFEPRIVPVAELVVSKAPLIIPPLCVRAPVFEVNVIAPPPLCVMPVILSEPAFVN